MSCFDDLLIVTCINLFVNTFQLLFFILFLLLRTVSLVQVIIYHGFKLLSTLFLKNKAQQKYSFEFKKKIVLEYLNGGVGYIGKKYGFKSYSKIKKWTKAYEKFGDSGLMRSRKNKSYSFNFKLNAVKLYLTTELSYSELALDLEINNPSLIANWVRNYRIDGEDALRLKKLGRKKSVTTKPKNNTKHIENTKKQNKTIDLNKEKLKKLEEENLKLRIENSYLKELMRLRLEEGMNLKKNQEQLTVSVKHLN